MNFQGVGPGGPHYSHGGRHQGQDMMIDPSMLGPVTGSEGYQDGGQSSGLSMFHHTGVPAEMDYRPVHIRQASVTLHPAGVSALCFDSQELLWAGTDKGHVCSFYGMEFHKHTAFHVSPRDDSQPGIRQILTIENGILSLTSTRLRLNTRNGPTTYCFMDSSMQQMLCMIESNPDTIVMGGHQETVLEFNTRRGQIINKFDVDEAGCTIFRHANKYLCAGNTTGKVTLYDPVTMRKEHVLEGHSGMLADFDVHGNLIVTSGYSTRMDKQLVADRLLMVYDMRVMRAMAPIQVSIDPTFLRFVPSLSHHLVIVSQMGSFQLLETAAMTTPSLYIYPVDTHGSGISSFDLSKTCQAMGFGDTAGRVHLFTNSEHAVFSGLDIPTEFADPVEMHHSMHLCDDLAYFAAIPTYYPETGTLLSEWPESMMQKIHRKSKPIDPDILRSAKLMRDTMTYVCNVPKNQTVTKKTLKNQAPYHLNGDGGVKTKLVPESPIGRGDDPFKVVPKEYQRMTMRYTKLDDFDFCHYNKTRFAGLTAEYSNSYCNAMLQVLYFIEPLRAVLLSHICQQEFCLACELGFLFHMLDTKKGEACQAKNFLRAFRTISEAAALGLLVPETEEVSGHDLLVRTPRWITFIVQQISSELIQHAAASTVPETLPIKDVSSLLAFSIPPPPQQHQDTPPPEKKETSTGGKGRRKKNRRGKKKEDKKTESADKETEEGSSEDGVRTQEEVQEETNRVTEESCVVKDLFFVVSNVTLLCRCGVESSKVEQAKITILQYPPNGQEEVRKITFAEVLQRSLSSESTLQTWCKNCERYQMHLKKRRVTYLPDVFAVDCNLTIDNSTEFWRQQIDIVKKEKEEANDGSSTHRPRTQCRYGTACRRSDCRYWHGAAKNFPSDGGEAEIQMDPSWIPMGLRMHLGADSSLTVEEISDEECLPNKEKEQMELYELYAVVYVIGQENTGRHLVSCIKVSKPYHKRKENVSCEQWYLINDFCLQPIEKPESVWVDLTWKIPILIYYTRRTYLDHHPGKVFNWCTEDDILYNDPALANPKRRKVTFLPLQPGEVLKKGDLIGIDAEFVSLKEEEAELRSDGTKSTIKPSHVSPGRITCIRGQGDLTGEPFIDDYILTPEQISDYLTEFSGIEGSELNPNTSTKHLTTLKSAYQKIRCLMDKGVVFVGHGLKKDFKVINIQVPKDQIVDTVQLFHQPNKRFISLRFLAWYFLEKNIQSGMHDSVEDARTALYLYKRYQQLESEGPEVVQAAIAELYETGRRMMWKVPTTHDDVSGYGLPDLDDPNFWQANQESGDDLLDQGQGFFEQ